MIKVPGVGNKNAEIAIIGEAPGADEICYREEGIFKPTPFVGQAGQRLTYQLNAAGIIRSNCWLDNLWKEKLKNDDFKVLWKDDNSTIPTKELQNSLDGLFETLRGMKNLKIIIPLGNVKNKKNLISDNPLYIFTGKREITKWRGSILPVKVPGLEHLKAVPVIHPSYILKNFVFNVLSVQDLVKAKKEIGIIGLNYPQYRFILPSSVSEITEFIYKALEAKKFTFLDIETIPDWRVITRFGLAYDKSFGISIPFYNFSRSMSWWTAEEEKIIWRALSIFLKSDIPKGIQNIPYDRSYCEWLYHLKINNITYDPMQAEHNISLGLSRGDDTDKSKVSVKPFGLASLTTKYTRQPFYKDDGKEVGLNGKKDDIKHSEYNITDCCVSLMVAEQQQRQTQFIKQKDIFEFEMKLVNGSMKWMSERGILVDVEYKEKMKNILLKRKEINDERINYLLGKRINLNSPMQISELLYTDLKMPKNKDMSTDEEQIRILKAKHPENKILDMILYNRTTLKTIENFSTEIDKDNRMRCQYSCLTQTGRLSSKKNTFKTGTNLQNRDRRGFVRKQFIADPGMVLVENDLEQAELRALAYMAGEEKMINQFKDKIDLFAKFGSKCLGREITKKANKLERDTFKTVVHGARNKMMGRTLSKQLMNNLGLYYPYPLCQKWIDEFFIEYPEIKKYQDNLIEGCNRKAVLRNPFGREIEFYDRSEISDNKRVVKPSVICAWEPQSFIGDLLNYIMLDWWEEENVPGECELLLQNHDAFLWQIGKDKVKEGIEKTRGFFNRVTRINGYDVLIPVEFKVGYSWGEMEEWKG